MAAPCILGGALIVKLPDELLLMILEMAADVTESTPALDAIFVGKHCEEHGAYGYTIIKQLMLVCRHFNQLSRPLLYRQIDMGSHQFGVPYKTPLSLNRTLQRDASLGKYCKVLRFQVHDEWVRWESEIDIRLALETMRRRLSNVQCIRLSGGLPIGTNALSTFERFFQSFSNLKHLHLTGHLYAPAMENCVSIVNGLHLEALRIDGGVQLFSIPTEDRGTGSFKRLSIRYAPGSVDSLFQLLLWPKSLEHLTFFKPSPFRPRQGWDVSSFQLMLEPVKHSLKTLELIQTPVWDRGSVLDLSAFSALEILHLSSYQLYCRGYQSLIPPQLRIFGLNLRRYNRIPESWKSFSSAQEQWLLDFARTAASRGVPLSKIEITFSPEYKQDPPQMGDEYPWDLIERLKGSVQEYGVTVEYNKPNRTRTQWLDFLAVADAPPAARR